MRDLLDRARRGLMLLFKPRASRDELDEEMHHHVALEAEALQAGGMSPDDARRTARQRFGNTQRYREEARSSWWVAWWWDLARDTRQALRWLRREPLFAAVAILTLGVGLGANGAMVGVMRATLFEELPYQNPADLMVVSHQRSNGASLTRVPAPDVVDFRADAPSFSGFAFVSAPRSVVVGTGTDFESARLGVVTANTFSLLGVDPATGRGFSASASGELTDEASSPVLLSHDYWQRRFGGSTGVLNQTVTIGGTSSTVIGVLPEGVGVRLPDHAGFSQDIDIWSPLTVTLDAFRRTDGRQLDQDSDNSGVVVGRLAPGRTLAAAQMDLDRIAQGQRARYPGYDQAGVNVVVTRLSDALAEPIRATILATLASVFLALLVICANLGSLLAARAHRRHGEMAIRTALGASRLRISRQLMAESGVLIAGGTLVAAAVYVVAHNLILALAPPTVSARVADVPAGGPLLAILALATVCVLVTSIAPAIMRPDPAHLRASRGHAGRSATYWRDIIVTGEVVLTTVLVIGSGMMLRTLVTLNETDPGFETGNRTVFELSLDGPNAGSPGDRSRFLDDLRRQLIEHPGIEHVGITGGLPLSGRIWEQPFGLDGQTPDQWAENSANFRVVNSDYFRAMGIPLRAGRMFTEDEDLFEDQRIVIVDAALASTIAPDGNAVGTYLNIPLDGSQVRAEVVGVVQTVRHESLRLPGRRTIYVPYRQEASRQLSVVVMGSAPLDVVRDEVTRVLATSGRNADVPAFQFRPLETLVAGQTAAAEFATTVATAFTIFVLLIATLGLHGVVTHAANDRRWEFGLRLAVGAPPQSIFKTVAWWGARLSLAGLVGGTVVALAGMAAGRTLLGVTPRVDPVVLAGTGLVFMVVTGAAVLAPARRASRIDPVESLRGR